MIFRTRDLSFGIWISHWGWWFPWPRTWKFLGHGFSRREINPSVFGDLAFAPTDDQWRRIEKRMPQGRSRSSSTAHTHTPSTATHYARVQGQAKRETERECARILVKEVDSLWKIVVSKKWIVLLAAEFKVPISEALWEMDVLVGKSGVEWVGRGGEGRGRGRGREKLRRM